MIDKKSIGNTLHIRATFAVRDRSRWDAFRGTASDLKRKPLFRSSDTSISRWSHPSYTHTNWFENLISSSNYSLNLEPSKYIETPVGGGPRLDQVVRSAAKKNEHQFFVAPRHAKRYLDCRHPRR